MWWSRNPSIFWGGLLVVLGLLFLLANTGALNQVNWDLVWPVVLIGLGLWMVAARFASGTLGATFQGSEPLDGLATCKLEILVGSARIDVRSKALGEQLYTVQLDRAGSQADVNFDRSTATLRISRHEGWFGWTASPHVQAQLSEAVLWQLDCRTGAVRGVFDLSTGRVAGFDCKTGASRVELSLPPPHGVVPIRIEGGSLRLDVSRPLDAAISVRATGAAVHLNADGTRQDGMGSREWRSAASDGAADRFDLVVAGGSTDVTVRQRAR